MILSILLVINKAPWGFLGNKKELRVRNAFTKLWRTSPLLTSHCFLQRSAALPSFWWVGPVPWPTHWFSSRTSSLLPPVANEQRRGWCQQSRSMSISKISRVPAKTNSNIHLGQLSYFTHLIFLGHKRGWFPMISLYHDSLKIIRIGDPETSPGLHIRLVLVHDLAPEISRAPGESVPWNLYGIRITTMA